MQRAPKTADQIAALAEILLGVAYADGTYDAQERQAIERLLAVYSGHPEPDSLAEGFQIPTAVHQRMRAFAPEDFDVFDAVVRLELDGRADAREILRLVMEMMDADAARDTSEESYFHLLGRALGLSDEAFELLLGFDDAE